MKNLVEFINERGPAPSYSNFIGRSFNQWLLKNWNSLSSGSDVQQNCSIKDIEQCLYDFDEGAETLSEKDIRSLQNALDMYKNLDFCYFSAEDSTWWKIADFLNDNRGLFKGFDYVIDDENYISVAVSETEDFVVVIFETENATNDIFIAEK